MDPYSNPLLIGAAVGLMGLFPLMYALHATSTSIYRPNREQHRAPLNLENKVSIRIGCTSEVLEAGKVYAFLRIVDPGTYDFKQLTGHGVFPEYVSVRKVESMKAVGDEFAFDYQMRERNTKQGKPVSTTADLVRDHGMKVEVAYLHADGRITETESGEGTVSPILHRIAEGFRDGEVSRYTNFDIETDGMITVTKRN